VDGLWTTKSKGVGLIVGVISFQDFQPMVLIYQRHRQTDRRMDERTDGTRSQDRALRYRASRGKN